MGILNCEPDVVSKIKGFSVRKNTHNCSNSTIRVVKTIRIHLNGVLPWLNKYPSLKIVHLVRDPLFQAQSRNQKAAFKCEKANISAYCSGYKEDLLNSPKVLHGNYKRVKYEDINADPIKTMNELYDFIGVPMSQEMIENIKEHFNYENVGKVKGRKNTYRTSDFDNRDLTKLPVHIKSEVKKECQDVMKMLEYSH